MGLFEPPEAAHLSPSLSSAIEALAAAARELAAAALALRGLPGPSQPPPSLSASPAPPLVEVVNSFLLSKARAGRSDRYLRQLRVSLRSLVAGRERTPVDQVTAADLDSWIRGRGWGARTVRGYAADAAGLFAWAMRRGWVRENPVRGVDLPRSMPGQVRILPPDQVASLLESAAAEDVGVARVLALRFFAGLRSAETLRLREEDIREGFVHVSAEKSKTRSRRVVRISPNLAAWLALPGGPLPVSEKRMRRVLTRRELPPNCARHSFCSYHLASFGNAGQTALEAGHAEAVLFGSYREMVTPAQAAEFWRIIPPATRPPAAPPPLPPETGSPR